ncbi:hypothetical protein [Longispora albida]|uniref:hypothetical protein n=1 Tax=Longispora albida TaxID=203523 RepID=UPI00035C79E6|nr:hypothetical protein [Longispora albida]
MTSFATYRTLVRQLCQHLTDRAGTAATTTAHTATANAAVTDLNTRLTEQATAITGAARRLRYPPPLLDTPPPAGQPADATSALADAERHAEESRRELASALHAAARPAFLPSAPARARNAAVYTATAALALIGQWTVHLGVEDWFASATWALLGIPALAYFTAIGIVLIVSRPRLPSVSAPGLAEANRRMGAAICWAMFPASWLLVTVLTDVLTT